MLDIDGNQLTMAGTFGTIGFGTLDPGNGTLEEQIAFTGLVNNSNGTVTLTGVKSVAFTSPYTQTSGLLKTHAGSTAFVISNTAGFYDKLTSKNDDETITGTWTFTIPNYPRMDANTPYPTEEAQFATKGYADSLTFAGAPNASPTQKGIVQIATQAETDARTLFGSTSAYLALNPSTQRSTLLSDYALDTSASANIIVIAPSPAITAYTTGQQFSLKTINTTTSPVVTLNVNGLGPKNIVLSNSTSPSIGEIVAGQVIEVEYDGTNFQLQSPSATSHWPVGSVIMHAGSTAPTGWLVCNGSPYSRTGYAALFAVIGTTYGAGDASTTFNVPDYRGRVPVGVGTGTGGGASGTGLPTGGDALTEVSRGTWKGEETHVLTIPEIPAHTHSLDHGVAGSTPNSQGGNAGANDNVTGSTGGGGAHNNIQPVMGINFIIRF